MKYTIKCVSKPLSQEYDTLISEYRKRLGSYGSYTWERIKPSTVAKESANILQDVSASDYLILLDEKGKNLTSKEHAELIGKISNRNVVYVVGGAYGVDGSVRERADAVLAFGSITLPHQLAQLVLAEQLFRVQAILSNHPYHHE